MTRIFVSVLVVFALFMGDAWAQKAAKSKDKAKGKSKDKNAQEFKLQSAQDSLSYALAYNFAKVWKDQGLDSLSFAAAKKGMKAGFGVEPTLLDENYINSAIQMTAQKLEEKQNEVAIKEGTNFLAANAKKPGVITTASGLQYEVLQMGNGEKPKATDQVTTHYEGRLIDGTVFDSSYKRGQPATFPLNGVIKGWTEALQLMPEGSKFRLFLPQDLAYGPRGAGNLIKPYSTLVFDVELIKIVK